MSEKLIAIKGFWMPETFIDCVMQFGGWCGVSPPEVDERVAETVDEAIKQKKPEWCPLIEIEKQQVRRGKWKRASKNLMTCSECGNCVVKDRISDMFFCPCCGADLRTPTQIQLDEADDVMMGGDDDA